MIERYTSAVRSTNLRSDERHSAIDAVMAMGTADVPLASLAIRAKFGDFPQAKAQLLNSIRGRCVARAVSRKWPSTVSPLRVADAVISFWLHPQCESCTGAKEIGYRVCPDCAGTGVRPIEATAAELPYVEDNIAFLNQTVSRAASAAGSRLRSR